MSARKKNSPYRQVRRAYRQDELARICTLPEREFGSAFGMQTVTVAARKPEDYYHFRDNGARVLAVAHLDTVVRAKDRRPHFSTAQSGPFIRCGALDDRLGAYVILRLLPELGISCDWLLTVGEESCRSTAEYFSPPKEYDWVIEFDRGGTDVVMYQYEDRASREAVQASGAQVGSGSFSDICYLDHLGVKAFNWGVGYRGNYHSPAGYAHLTDTFTMVAKYLRFHAQNAGTAMPHEPEEPGRGRSYRYWWQEEGEEENYYADCPLCDAGAAVEPGTGVCMYCDNYTECRFCGVGEAVRPSTQVCAYCGKKQPAYDYDDEAPGDYTGTAAERHISRETVLHLPAYDD